MGLLAAKSSLLPVLVVLVVLAALARARARPPSRARLLVVGAGSVAGAIFLLTWGPPRIPDTPGSPAALVLWLVLVSFAGTLGVVGIAALLRAALRGPRR